MPVLLYIVDDEPLITGMLGHFLEFVSKDWNVKCFEKPLLALESAKTEKPNVVISDFRMPQMTGTELLEGIRQIMPECIRILISGYVNPNAIDNKLTSAHQYLAKPFSMPDINAKVHKALNAVQNFKNLEIRREVLSLRTLPALPQSYYELLTALEDVNVSYSKVESILNKDTAIVAKVLQLANSPLFGGHDLSPVTDLMQCISILGTERLKGIVLSHQVFKSYTNIPDCFMPQCLVQHRFDTANFAYAFAEEMDLSEDQARDAYVAGLLHDLGRLVLIDNFDKDHEILRNRAKAENRSLSELEMEKFNLTQADIIGFLLGLWGMRERISSALTFQEHPWDAPSPDFQRTAAAVYLAHYKAHQTRHFSQFKQPELNKDYLQKNNWGDLLKA